MKKFIYLVIITIVPFFTYGQLNNSYNYIYKVNYKVPVADGAQHLVTDSNKTEQVIYYDDQGRPIQVIIPNAGGDKEDVIGHYEYDELGRETKTYLPYVSNLSNPLGYVSNVKSSIAPFYLNKFPDDFQDGTNPYSEVIAENSPIGKILKQAAPGSDWKVKQDDTDHNLKFDYRSNNYAEVARFDVLFQNDNTILPQLFYNGNYLQDQLIVTITKNENWTSTNEKVNTTETFSDKSGRKILTREYLKENGNYIVHNTYYVYDFYGNLTFVIPPAASDAIESSVLGLVASGSNNYPWTTLVQVDENLALEYNKLFSEYNNEIILNNDLLQQYGGQGGFLLDVNNSNELVLTINISTLNPVKFKNGEIVSLNNLGRFKDIEIGRISANNYDYVFSIKNNSLFVDGSGEVSSVSASFVGNSRLDYNQNYSWTTLIDVDPEEASRCQTIYDAMDNQLILNTVVENNYGANGGINISIDENDLVSINLNITATSPVKFKKGIVFPLDIQRRVANRDLGIIEGTGCKYYFKIFDNSLYIEGDGNFTNVNRISATPPNVSNIVPIQIIEGLCYEYHYDDRNRLVEKKVPGKGWEYLVYDKMNRVVLTQDANYRLQKKWLFTKYDMYSNNVYSGQIDYNSSVGNSNSQLREELQAIYDTTTVINETRTATAFQNGGIDINYTDLVFPKSINTGFTVNSVNYFDNYNYNPLGSGFTIPTAVYSSTTNVLTNLKSLPTSSLVRILDTGRWKMSLVAYDLKERPIWAQIKNTYQATTNTSELKLDFAGKVLENTTTYLYNTNTLTIVNKFAYDHADRIIKQTQKINTQSEELIYFNHYDELGQLDQKKVGGVAPTTATLYGAVTTALQTVDFNYNVRGWLKNINNPDQSLTSDLFAFKINYNKPQGTTAPLYNGNISQTSWKTITDNKVRGYNYTYDELNRLKQANYVGNYALAGTTSQIENYKEGDIKYDKNGNITGLLRFGLTSRATPLIDVIDKLTYIYEADSNKLSKIVDTADPVAGFKNIDTASPDYSYDINGNLKKDVNKNITNIEYNQFNLPTKIVFNSQDPDTSPNPNGIKYRYDAAGKKIEKIVYKSQFTSGVWSTTQTVTQYDDNYIYENGRLQFFSQPEGYVAHNNGVFSYVYQYKDHLGNVRLSYKATTTGALQVVEENQYYPFGLKQQGYNNVISPLGNAVAQRFDFNGKETEESFGLNISEMDFRQYDPSTGRFYNIDLLAEATYSKTPYHFAGNNPVIGSDPTGLLTYFNGKDHSQPQQVFGQNGYGMINMYGNTQGSFLDNLHNDYGSNAVHGGGMTGSSGGGGGSGIPSGTMTMSSLFFLINLNGGGLWTNDGFGNFGNGKTFINRDGAAYQDPSFNWGAVGEGDKYAGFEGDSMSTPFLDVDITGKGRGGVNSDSIPCVQCHHTTSPQFGSYSMPSIAWSGYVITANGEMRSDFIGDKKGPGGQIYHHIDEIFTIKKWPKPGKIGNLRKGLDKFLKALEKRPPGQAFSSFITNDTIYNTIITPSGMEKRGYDVLHRHGYIMDGDSIFYVGK
ncbi:DUF6443 domain-containing protein [Flavobacterium sp.]|uniref:DUF6443 domain-containing protein n=1 Tax=Flavobacterium sp. TaxID=239 RepID=UPI000EC230AA|nr:DUF6443 domain-containing protein [Flavobacterium sp.]HCQ12820.1 hypothetical protein [Flavobacterium sp.]